MRRIVWLSATFAVALVVLYLSKFWPFELWGREGLWGIGQLRPQGDLVSQWMRQFGLAPFDLIVWTFGAFAIFTGMEKLYARFSNNKH